MVHSLNLEESFSSKSSGHWSTMSAPKVLEEAQDPELLSIRTLGEMAQGQSQDSHCRWVWESDGGMKCFPAGDHQRSRCVEGEGREADPKRLHENVKSLHKQRLLIGNKRWSCKVTVITRN